MAEPPSRPASAAAEAAIARARAAQETPAADLVDAALSEPSAAETSTVGRSGAAAKDDRNETVAEDEEEHQQQAKEDKGKGKAVEQDDALERFSCHICLDLPEQPVLTPWLVVSGGKACPVCKTALTVDSLIPIYSGAGDEKDPRKTALPPRPRPAAPAPSSAASFLPARPSGLFSPPSSAFTFQAGILPLPGLSMAWSWPPERMAPPLDVEEERARMGLRNPHGGAQVMAEQQRAAAWAQQAFMVLFFALFVMITFSG
ncbi:hypothetical protein JCM10207_007584 [Rhodosporidiobolus poonsookiae]